MLVADLHLPLGVRKPDQPEDRAGASLPGGLVEWLDEASEVLDGRPAGEGPTVGDQPVKRLARHRSLSQCLIRADQRGQRPISARDLDAGECRRHRPEPVVRDSLLGRHSSVDMQDVRPTGPLALQSDHVDPLIDAE